MTDVREQRPKSVEMSLTMTAVRTAPKKVCIVGSGNWGSAIARLVGRNAARLPDKFVKEVNMWVFEEEVEGEKLSHIINTRHENVKYLPGRTLPDNIVAVPDLVSAASSADLLIFVIPHQFLPLTCQTLQGNLKPGVHALSLIKGFSILPSGGFQLISSVINDQLSIPVSVLMGANLADEVADEKFCESTIGASDKAAGAEFQLLFNSENFLVSVVSDASTVEVCGALKNVVACGAGFCDGMKLGDNAKAAVIRLGLKEMMSFTEKFYPGGSKDTFLESCGVADLVVTCYGGRNRKVAQAFVTSEKTMEQLEEDMLKGQKLQGPQAAKEINFMLKENNLENEFPLLTQIHKICIGEAAPESIMEAMRSHGAQV